MSDWSRTYLRFCVKCGHKLSVRINVPFFFSAMDAALFEDDLYAYSKCPFCGGTTAKYPNPKIPVKEGAEIDEKTGKRIYPILDINDFPSQYR